MTDDRSTPPPPDGRDLWVFAYGSLIWDPGFEFAEARPALLRGYHRAFCLYSKRYRGTPERPGLVLGLDRGGATCRLVEEDAETDRRGTEPGEQRTREMHGAAGVEDVVDDQHRAPVEPLGQGAEDAHLAAALGRVAVALEVDELHRRVAAVARQGAGEIGGEHEGAVEDHDHHVVRRHRRDDVAGHRVDPRGDRGGVDQGRGRGLGSGRGLGHDDASYPAARRRSRPSAIAPGGAGPAALFCARP